MCIAKKLQISFDYCACNSNLLFKNSIGIIVILIPLTIDPFTAYQWFTDFTILNIIANLFKIKTQNATSS